MNINLGYNASVQTVAKTFSTLSAEQWGQAYWQACRNDGIAPTAAAPLYGTGITPQLVPTVNGVNTTNTDWQDQVYSAAWTQNVSASISNASDKGSYLFSANYINQKGLMDYTFYKRFTGRVTSTYNFNKYIRVGENLMVAKWNNRGADTNGDRGIPYSAMRQHPAIPVYASEGVFSDPSALLGSDIDNPVQTLYNLRDNSNSSWRIFGNAYLEIMPVKGLTLKSNLVNAFRTDPRTGLPLLDGSFNEVNVTEDYDGTLDPRLDFTVGRIGFPWRGHTYTRGWCRAYDVYGEYSNKKAWEAPGVAHSGFPWGCSSLNFMFIRYADILLLQAEALIETASGANASTDNNLVEARKLINQVRQRAANSIDGSYSPQDLDPAKADYYVGLYPEDFDGNLAWTKDYARLALRMERRLELALEGHRWFDLMRWGNDYLVSTMNKYMNEESKLRQYYAGRQVSTNEIFMPVPLSEIDNSNGLYKQY